MARPRVFISSTFYDLRIVRDDLQNMLNRIGYDPILNERGLIPYEKDKRLEESCYREVANCDIFVAIIGNRFGTQSALGHYSISQMEFRAAADLEKPTFTFVDKAVATEYRTWLKNKDVKNWAHVDDSRIYEFLEFVHGLRNNNPVQPFETSTDIMDFLRDQFAGLFQRLLADYSRRDEVPVTNQLRSLVDLLTSTASRLSPRDLSPEDAAALFANQPFFSDLRGVLRSRSRVLVLNYDELDSLLSSHRLDEVPADARDDAQHYEWIREVTHRTKEGKEHKGVDYDFLKIDKRMFDDSNRVRFVPPEEYTGIFQYQSRTIQEIKDGSLTEQDEA